MKKRATIFVFLLLALVTACEFDAVLEPKVYPQIETLEPIMDSTGVLFRAHVKNASSKPILRYGFVWSMSSNPTIENQSVLFDNDLLVDSFSTRIIDGIVNSNLFVRAYVSTEDYESYGCEVEFKSNFFSKPIISDFYPKMGYAGDSIVLTGRNLSLPSYKTTAKMGNYSLQIESCTSTRLVVKVPQMYGRYNYPIMVSLGPQSMVSDSLFEVRYNWTQKKSIPVNSNYAPVYFSSESKGYIIRRASQTILEYYPPTDSWSWMFLPMNSGGQLDYSKSDTLLSNLSVSETQLLAFSAGNKAYIFLSGVFWEYNALLSTWTRKAAFPGVLEMEKRTVFGMFINGKLYLGNCGENKSFWEYDPNRNSWTSKADFIPFDERALVSGNTAFAVQNKAYVAVTTSNRICKLYCYDPVLNVWNTKGNLPYLPYSHPASFVIDDVAYVGLGYSLGNDFWKFFKYDAATDTWTSCVLDPNIGNTYVDATFVIKGKAYWIIPYWLDNEVYENWEYEPTKK